MFIPGLETVSPALPNFAHPLNSELELWLLSAPGYNGFGSDKWLDISGNHNHGTLTNMDPGTDWKGASRPGGRGALEFAAGSEYLDFNAGILPSTSAWSVSVWCFWTVAARGYLLVDIDNVSNFLLFRQSNHDFEFFVAGTQISDSSVVLPGVWHLMRLVLDGAVATSYIDGIQVGSQGGLTWTGMAGDLRVGNRTALDRDWIGQADDIRIWNRASSESEGALLHLESLQGYPNLLSRDSFPLVAPAAAAAGTRNPLVMGSTNLLRGKI